MKLTPVQEAKQKDLYSKMVKPHQEPSRLNIQVAHLPEIKDWDVGKTYEVKLKAKMTSKSEGGWDGKQPLRAEFQVGTESGEEDD